MFSEIRFENDKKRDLCAFLTSEKTEKKLCNVVKKSLNSLRFYNTRFTLYAKNFVYTKQSPKIFLENLFQKLTDFSVGILIQDEELKTEIKLIQT